MRRPTAIPSVRHGWSPFSTRWLTSNGATDWKNAPPMRVARKDD